MSGIRAVNARLKAVSGVTDLVSTRIWTGRLGSDTLEAIRLAEVGQRHDHLMGADSGVVTERVQVDCYGNTVAEAKALAAAVKAALNRQSGTLGTVAVQDIAIETEAEYYEDDASLDGARVYRVMQEYTVYWEG